MSISKPKTAFTRQDIVEILKQNYELYKAEPAFVDYFVDLALYLVDQAYCISGERCANPEEIARRMEDVREALLAFPASSEELPFAASGPVPADADADDEWLSDRRLEEPPTNKLRLEALEAVMRDPPPADAGDGQSGDKPGADGPPGDAGQPGEGGAADPAQDEAKPRKGQEMQTTKQLISPGALTPLPEGGLAKKSKEGVDFGRAKVYRVVKNSTGKGSKRTACPICGADTSGAKTCPSCGHIMH